MKKLLSVEASAGSGKTFRLVNRYISILNLDESSNILAITFTNKAANEMRERVIKFLKELGSDENVVNMICSELNISKNELLNRKALLIKRFLTSDTNIQTIDAFINKILRKFSYLSGIRTNFEIGEDNKDIIFRNFLDSLSDEEFKNLIQISKSLQISDINLFFESFYSKDKELKNISFQYSFNFTEIVTKIEDIKNRFILATQDCKSVNTYFQKDIKGMLKTKTIQSFLEQGSLEKVRGFKKCFDGWMDSEFRKLIELIKEYFLAKEELFFNNLFYFYNKYKEEKWKFKKEENILGFKDIEHLAYELLREKINSDFLYFRLDSHISHILIDEFQDTSVTQWEIFEPIIDEIASGVGVNENRSFFYVGDVKQAIYRFRGGKKELFEAVSNKYQPLIEKEYLDTNFRSAENIVDFVNQKFNLEEKVHRDEAGYVEVDSIKEDTFETIYEKVEFLNNQGVNDNDIAILVYANKNIIEIGDFLESKGKKVVTSKKALVKSQKSAKAIISLMKYLEDDKKLIQKLNFLSLIGKKWGTEINIKIDRPILMIREIMKTFDLTDEATLKLLYYSKKHDTLFDFVREIDSYSEELPLKELDGIKITTIHKSKGLEFDNVIVLDKLSDKKPNPPKIMYVYDGVRLIDLKYRDTNRELIDNDYKFILQKEDKLSLEDKKNVEYVAFTRAKNSLIILKKEKSNFLTELESGYKKGAIIPSKANNITKIERERVVLRNYGKQEVKVQEEEYKANDYKAIYFGTALHYSFECEDIEAVRNQYGDFCDIDKIAKMYKQGIEILPKGQREVPFIIDEKVGIIDLLTEDEIIDYKSTRPNDEKGYLKQVRNYIDAIQKLSGKKLKGKLFYADSMEFREV